MIFDDYEAESGKGIVFVGQAGSGKTTLLCQMVKNDKNSLVLSFTNKAIENVKERLTKMEIGNVNEICHTFDSYFCEWNGLGINNLQNKTIFIEEYSMVPNKWMTIIYKAFTMFNNKIYLFGDSNQCSPIECGSQISYDYLESVAINNMCPTVTTLEYIENTCRYDKKTHKMLHTFLKHGKLSTYFQPIDKKLYKNICYLNSTRKLVNADCCNQFTKDKKYETVEFTYNNMKESYKVCKNMPIIATTNLKDKEIFNSMEFVVEKIRDNFFKVNNEWYNKEQFSESFIPSFCVTVYKYQGADIDEQYNIYDTERMDIKQLYTSLSRTTRLDYIHLDNNKINNQYFIRRQPILELTNSKFNSLYKDGKIYLVTFSNEMKYIGSTCESLDIRLKWHLSNKSSQVFKYKNKKPDIKLITNAPSNDRTKLLNIENAYIEEYALIYGEKLLNKKCNPLKKKKKVKKIEYKVEMENETQLRERIALLDKKFNIKDDEKNSCWYFDANVDGKRIKTMARYSRNSKKEALTKIEQRKQKKIDELTIYFE